jgi:4'-phosphopantetheinyl transferase
VREKLEDVTHGKTAPADAARGIVALASPTPAAHLWRCDLTPIAKQVQARRAMLSSAELERAARFGSPLLRERYILGRGALRTILGCVLDVAPDAVPIVRGRRGRPQLAQPEGPDFNLSNTASVAFVGVCSTGRIGVDIERCDRSVNVAGIARKFHAESERDALASLSVDAARRDVLALWTAKDAMSKATGDALAAPFAQIAVDVRTMRVRAGPGAYAPHRWVLHRVDAGPDYFATIALWQPDASAGP